MHRHGYQGRKLSRQRDQRQALVRGQLISLVLYEQTTTTLAKAKELAPHFDRLVTKAKQDTLAGKRSVHAELTTGAAWKLLTELVPAFGDRTSGFSRITKIANRRGDNAEMAVISLVLPEKTAGTPAKADATAAETKIAEDSKLAKEVTAAKPKAKKAATKKAGAAA